MTSFMHQPQIAILGAGAIGGLFAAALAEIGKPVALILRPQAPTGSTLSFTALQGAPAKLLKLPVHPIDAMLPPDILLVCTKAQHAAAAVTACAPYCDQHTQLVLLHNGLGVMEELPDAVRDWKIYSAVTLQAAHRSQPLHIAHTGSGATWLGASLNADYSTAQDIAKALSTPTCPVSVVRDIKSEQWRKLALNCALNPLTALYDVCNGEVAAHPEASALQRRLVEEIMAVGEQLGEGYRLPSLPAQLAQAMQDTYANPNSMRCDVKAGIETEIGYINGYLCKLAAQAGIEAPLNLEVTRRIEALRGA